MQKTVGITANERQSVRQRDQVPPNSYMISSGNIYLAEVSFRIQRPVQRDTPGEPPLRGGQFPSTERNFYGYSTTTFPFFQEEFFCFGSIPNYFVEPAENGPSDFAFLLETGGAAGGYSCKKSPRRTVFSGGILHLWHSLVIVLVRRGLLYGWYRPVFSGYPAAPAGTPRHRRPPGWPTQRF